MTRRQLSHHRRQQRRQRIIFFGGIGVIVAVILIIVIGWASGNYLPLHKTVITVYDTKYHTAYFVDRLKLAVASQSASGTAMTSSGVNQIASNLIGVIIQDEMEKQEAARLGVRVDDANVTTLLKINNIPSTAATRDAAIAQLLPDKLKSDYFNTIVPVSDNQVYMKGMMVESEDVAKTVRDRMISGDNITMLANRFRAGLLLERI